MFVFAYALVNTVTPRLPEMVVGCSGMDCVNRIKPVIVNEINQYFQDDTSNPLHDLSRVGTVPELTSFLQRWLPHLRGVLVSDQVQ